MICVFMYMRADWKRQWTPILRFWY